MKKNSSKWFRLAGVVALMSGIFVCFAWVCPGRMTGGGSIFRPDGSSVDSAQIDGTGRITHGFELHCQCENTPAPPLPNNLQINWKGGPAGPGQHHFHLDVLTQAICFNNTAFSPLPPAASFNTMVGMGTGSLDNQAGATIQFTLTDAGQPGVNSTAEYHIKDSSGAPVLDAPACADPSAFNPSTGGCDLHNGAQQAHDGF